MNKLGILNWKAAKRVNWRPEASWSGVQPGDER
jgi:hypothetical protein